MTYREAVDWLYGQQLHGIKLGLETMEQLCAALGVGAAVSALGRLDTPRDDSGLQPERPPAGRAVPAFIHVAGTNGKGSVCAMLAACFQAGGLRTGLYTSPHLVTFRERMRLNGKMISEQEIADGMTLVRDAARGLADPPTFFEIATALAFDWFEEQRAHLVVLETGLGGRLDATNVVLPVVSVLTPIAFDHERFLGNTLSEIAAEKCGIIKPGIPVVTGPQPPEVFAVIARTARDLGSELLLVEAELEPEWAVGLPGAHQRWNAALARAALEFAGVNDPLLKLPPQAVMAGISKVEWPGRFQRVGERIVLDGAHNPAAAATLATTWRSTFGEQKATLIVGVMRDKNVRGVLATLAPIAQHIIGVPVDNERACSADELVAVAREVAPNQRAVTASSLDEAIRQAEALPHPILIAGSLFLVGEAFAILGIAEPTNERSDQ